MSAKIAIGFLSVAKNHLSSYMDAAIQLFFEKLPVGQKPTALLVRKMILTAFPQVAESIKWNQLTFHYRGSNLAFLYCPSGDYLNLGFFKATSLHDPENLLEGTGKRMRHIKLFPGTANMPTAQINSWFAEAINLAALHKGNP